MNDVQQIVCFLSAYYLVECLYWARPGSVAFVSQFGERHRPRTPGSSAVLSNIFGGLVPGNLLPWGDSTLAQFGAFAASPDGVVAHAPWASESTAAFHSFADLGRLSVDQSTLLVGDVPFAWAGSPSLATAQLDFLRTLVVAPCEQRATLIDRALSAGFDSDAAAERLIAARRATRSLRACCTTLFLCVFAVLPAVAFAGLPIPLYSVVVAYFSMLAATLVVFAATHRALFPDARSARWKQMLMMAVSPADAVHACNSLLRRALESYQPLALGAALCSREQFESMARATLLEFEHPLPSVSPPADPQAAEAAAWFRERFVAASIECIRRQALDPEQLTAPPRSDSPESIAYCPRCHGQYIRAGGRCTTCDLPLQPFAEAALRS